MSKRQGVEIDFCPQCRGVWLDRGELDKIIERAARLVAPAPGRAATGPPPLPPVREGDRDRRHGREYDDDDDDYRGPHGQRKKGRGFLGDLFD